MYKYNSFIFYLILHLAIKIIGDYQNILTNEAEMMRVCRMLNTAHLIDMMKYGCQRLHGRGYRPHNWRSGEINAVQRNQINFPLG
ncbi:hypothetical protein PEC301889_02940 [Pectobacterium carotovorum subsp. carotovorum]|nr:hypothetical protein PEC301889_02940 [Pectobacterium carotovorum subsp. carotovorum]